MPLDGRLVRTIVLFCILPYPLVRSAGAYFQPKGGPPAFLDFAMDWCGFLKSLPCTMYAFCAVHSCLHRAEARLIDLLRCRNDPPPPPGPLALHGSFLP